MYNSAPPPEAFPPAPPSYDVSTSGGFHNNLQQGPSHNVPVQQGPVVQMQPQQVPVVQQIPVVQIHFGRQPVSKQYIKHNIDYLFARVAFRVYF